MLFAFVGLLVIAFGFSFSNINAMLLGFGLMFFDLITEIVNLKTQLHAVGVALRDELRELKEKI